MPFSKLSHQPDQHQFQLYVHGQTAWVDYRMRGNIMYLVHAEVPYRLRGRGVGKELVEKVFEYLEAHDLKAIPVCSFIRTVARRHPKWSQVYPEEFSNDSRP